MKGFVADIEDRTEENTDFRRVLYTGRSGLYGRIDARHLW
jgi:hypothetical protein